MAKAQPCGAIKALFDFKKISEYKGQFFERLMENDSSQSTNEDCQLFLRKHESLEAVGDCDNSQCIDFDSFFIKISFFQLSFKAAYKCLTPALLSKLSIVQSRSNKAF